MHTPSSDLLKEVREHLVLRGSSLNAFCRENGLIRQNVTSALTGAWRGPKATALVEVILAAVRVDQ